MTSRKFVVKFHEPPSGWIRTNRAVGRIKIKWELREGEVSRLITYPRPLLRRRKHSESVESFTTPLWGATLFLQPSPRKECSSSAPDQQAYHPPVVRRSFRHRLVLARSSRPSLLPSILPAGWLNIPLDALSVRRRLNINTIWNGIILAVAVSSRSVAYWPDRGQISLKSTANNRHAWSMLLNGSARARVWLSSSAI